MGVQDDRSTAYHAQQKMVMTVKEVAAYLQISDAKVYRMARVGQIPAFRIGRAWRFRRDLIDQWMQQNCIEKNGQ